MVAMTLLGALTIAGTLSAIGSALLIALPLGGLSLALYALGRHHGWSAGWHHGADDRKFAGDRWRRENEGLAGEVARLNARIDELNARPLEPKPCPPIAHSPPINSRDAWPPTGSPARSAASATPPG